MIHLETLALWVKDYGPFCSDFPYLTDLLFLCPFVECDSYLPTPILLKFWKFQPFKLCL